MKTELCSHVTSKTFKIFPGTVIVFLTWGIASLLNGCNREELKEPMTAYPSASLGQLLQLIDLSTQRITDLKAKVEIKAVYPTGKMKDGKEIYNTQEVGGYIAVRRPGHIWLNTSKLGKTVLAGQSDGKKFWLAFSFEKKLFVGSADIHVPRRKESDIAFSPSDIVEVLIVDEFDLTNVYTILETLRDQYIIYAIRLLPGGRPKLYSKVWIERESGKFDITKHQLFDVNGQLRVEATFHNYKMKDMIKVPSWVRIQWPGWRTNIVMDLYSIKINPSELRKKNSAKLFKYQIPETFRKYEEVDVDQ